MEKITSMKNLFVLLFAMALFGCGATPKIPLGQEYYRNTSSDPEYGYTQEKPIKLGGFMVNSKYAGKHSEYFEGLMGPHGEQVQVERLGSCCMFEDDSLELGGGLLDRYQLSYEGLKQPMIIYVNLYQFERPMAPQGFILE